MSLLELMHGVTRANTAERHDKRQRFLHELMRAVPTYPVNVSMALRAGQIDGQTQTEGVRIALADLLIGVTALELGYAIGTANVRDFRRIPGLKVVQL